MPPALRHFLAGRGFKALLAIVLLAVWAAGLIPAAVVVALGVILFILTATDNLRTCPLLRAVRAAFAGRSSRRVRGISRIDS
jgi:hypothetical protein